VSRTIQLPGTHVAESVATPDVQRVEEVVDFLVELREIGAVLGSAGVGKTFAADVSAAHSGLPVVTLDMPPRPAPKEVTVRLLREVQGFADTSSSEYELTEELVEILAAEPRVIVIDEAQNLTAEGLNKIRYLHDRPDADWALLLVGGQDCGRALHSQKQLESRVARWVTLEPLQGDILITALRAYHQLFAFTSSELLIKIDQVFGRGTWRHWARFLQEALRLQARTGYDVLDHRFAAAVIHQIGQAQGTRR
jgi:hypothetical protein